MSGEGEKVVFSWTPVSKYFPGPDEDLETFENANLQCFLSRHKGEDGPQD